MSNHLSILDFSIVFIYLAICLVLGFSRKNKVTTLREYAVGSRSISTLALITAIFATKIGAGATIGEIERVYTLGLFFALSLIAIPLFWFITSKIFAKNIDNFRDCISLTDIMRKLYGEPGRWVTVVASIADSVGTVSVQLSALGFLTSFFFDLDYMYGVCLGAVLVCAYVTFGGARSVVLTDVFQFIVFYAVVPLACVFSLKSIGSIDNLIEKLPQEMKTLNFEGANLWIFLSFMFYAILPAISGTFVQRFLMSKNSTQLKYSLNCLGLIAVPFVVILCMIGFIVKALDPNIDPNQAFYYLVANHLPIGVVGLAIAAVLAIIMSTANSWLNSGATIMANDIARTFHKNMTEKQGLFYARISTVIITLLSILLAHTGGSVMTILWFTDSMWYPMMLVPLVYGLFGYKTHGKSFVISSILAVIAATYVAFVMGTFNALSVIVGILVSLASFTLINYSIDEKKKEYLKLPYVLVCRTISALRSIFSKSKFINLLYSNERARSANYITFCIFILFQYIPSIFDSAISTSHLDNEILYLKLSTILFALLLFTFEQWPLKIQEKFAPPFWYFNIFYTLCFVSNLLLISSTDKYILIINLLLSVILLVLFLPVIASISFMSVGFILAYTTCSYLDIVNITGTVGVLITEIIIPIAYGIIGVFLIYMLKMGFDKRYMAASENASFVAHEAISPLATINIALETLNTIIQNASNTSDNKYKKIRTKDCDMISELAKNLIRTSESGISRVSAILNTRNDLYPDIAVYSAFETSTEVLDEFQKEIEIKNTGDFTFYGSKEAVKTVISNLIRNSIKYAGNESAIIIKINDAGSISVIDDGTGISKSILNKIFSERVTTKGYGHGLKLCKKIVEDHGGTITCDSREGKGTTFTFSLMKV